jgi:23S rRNA pseudouridine1911/1915/1917 synthase
MKRLLIVPPEANGNRADVFLSSFAENLSRNAAQKLCESGLVLKNGKPVNKKECVRIGDTIEYELPDPVMTDALPENIPLDIVFEDDYLLVVNKPQGMVVHPAPGNYTGTLVNALLYHCGDRLSSINGVIRPGIVHRIDKDTSGLLVVAKDDRVHTALAERFAVHDIDRVYDAILCGCPKNDEGTVDAPIGRHPVDRKRMCITEHHSRRAVTHYEVIERFAGYSYVKCHLETGRTHQIRVHMASIGHPVAGDPVYGPAKGIPGINGQLLHAGLLGFVHPITGEHMIFTAPPPEVFTRFLEKLRRTSK